MSGQQSGPPQGGGWQQPQQGGQGAPGPGGQQPTWGGPGAWGQPQPQQGWGGASPSQPQRASRAPGSGPLPTIAVVGTLVAAVVALVYGGYAIIFRRGIFSDLAGSGSVTVDDASSSDTTNGVLLAITLVVVIVALGLWVAVLVTARRGRNPLGFGGLGAIGVGAICALVGGFLSSGVENADDAGTAATGYVLVGLGFVLVALGNLVGAAGLRQPAADTSGRDDRRGGSGFGDGRPQQPSQGGWGTPPQQPGQNQPGQNQPGQNQHGQNQPGQNQPGWGGPPQQGPGSYGRPPQQGGQQPGWGPPPTGPQQGPGSWGPPGR